VTKFVFNKWFLGSVLAWLVADKAGVPMPDAETAGFLFVNAPEILETAKPAVLGAISWFLFLVCPILGVKAVKRVCKSEDTSQVEAWDIASSILNSGGFIAGVCLV